MNHKLFLFFVILVCINCRNELDENLESLGENRQVETVETCLCSELETTEDKTFTKNGALYTGNCIIKYHDSDQSYIEKQIVNGRLNGKIIYYGSDGTVLFEEKYEKGTHQLDLDVENITCNCNDLIKEKRDKLTVHLYKGQLFRGECYSNFPGLDQPYIRISYTKGLRNGFTWYYNKFGDILYTEKYKDDELTKVIYPKK
ncbi:MAG: hypothetical protein AB8B74_07135 [Crocinitomicaceae bacterium]